MFAIGLFIYFFPLVGLRSIYRGTSFAMFRDGLFTAGFMARKLIDNYHNITLVPFFYLFLLLCLFYITYILYTIYYLLYIINIYIFIFLYYSWSLLNPNPS